MSRENIEISLKTISETEIQIILENKRYINDLYEQEILISNISAECAKYLNFVYVPETDSIKLPTGVIRKDIFAYINQILIKILKEKYETPFNNFTFLSNKT